MKAVFLFYFKTLLLWLGLLAASKVYFLLVNVSSFSSLSELPNIWWQGLQLDFSLTSYILILLLVFTYLSFFQLRFFNRFWRIVMMVLATITIVILAVDPYFYWYWGQKANFSFVPYLKDDTAGIGSVYISHYIKASIFMIVCVWLFWFFSKKINLSQTPKWWQPLLFLPIFGILLRGGISNIPLNISSAYYSDIAIYNNAAVNPVWNLLANEFDENYEKHVDFLDKKIERHDFQLPDKNKLLPPPSWLAIQPGKTNVVMVILESFSAKMSGKLTDNGYAYTPNFDAISANGILFERAYASSFRSDKGLLGLYTGVPSMARQTLTNLPNELARQPNLNAIFKENGYHTSFFYGGNIEFANLKVLFSGVDLLAGQTYFDADKANVWGVHDEITLPKYLESLRSFPQPFFSGLFTLSSHEPFDVPGYHKYKEPYINAISYTDSCLGVFMNDLKNSKLWDNTLVILVADHGTYLPNKSALLLPENFHIPILLTGGVVKRDSVVSNVVSQLDIPASLTSLFFNKQPFTFAAGLFKEKGEAYYSYHDGLAYIDNNNHQVYDFFIENYITDVKFLAAHERLYYQAAMDDFFSYRR